MTGPPRSTTRRWRRKPASARVRIVAWHVSLLADGVDPRTGQRSGVDAAARVFELFLARNAPARTEAAATDVGGRPHLDRGSDRLFRLHGGPGLTADAGSTQRNAR